MTRTQLILASLVLGVVVGLALRWADQPTLTAAAGVLLPLGQLWVRALQMTLIPLIFAMITHGVASAVIGGRGGAMIGTTLAVFVAIMVATVAICTVLVETALHLWPIPPNALAGLIAGAPPPQPVPGLAAQFLAIVPDNPVAAAAQGQIFPLVIFGLAFGIAIARLPRAPDGGEPAVMALMAQVARAMMSIVDWVLVVAPAGIFCLALGLGLSSGLGVARVLGTFVALSFATAGLMAALCYLLVRLAGVPLGRFAAAIAPAQAMGAGSCSSMASTPVMIEVAIERLGLPADLVGLVIPMAVSVFRLGTVAHAVAAVLVAAHAVGIQPSVLQLVLAGVAVILGSISGAGLPGAAVIYAIYGPGIQLLGAPMAIMPLYVAVIALPDPVITLSSVTGDLTAAALVDRLLRRRAVV